MEASNDIQNVLDDTLTDIIYVRIGTRLPFHIQYELVGTFRDMKEMFIWEHDRTEIMLPSNVIIQNPLPSKLILSHKNTILFITKDDTKAIKHALHYGVPMIIAPYQNSENMESMEISEINKQNLGDKLKIMLNKKKLKAHAKEIDNLLHHKSVSLCSDFILSNGQKSRQLTPTHLHLDALGALFFVIFVIVKLSLKFCQFYNNWEWKANATTKKTK